MTFRLPIAALAGAAALLGATVAQAQNMSAQQIYERGIYCIGPAGFMVRGANSLGEPVNPIAEQIANAAIEDLIAGGQALGYNGDALEQAMAGRLDSYQAQILNRDADSAAQQLSTEIIACRTAYETNSPVR